MGKKNYHQVQILKPNWNWHLAEPPAKKIIKWENSLRHQSQAKNLTKKVCYPKIFWANRKLAVKDLVLQNKELERLKSFLDGTPEYYEDFPQDYIKFRKELVAKYKDREDAGKRIEGFSQTKEMLQRKLTELTNKSRLLQL
jgi:hypothetical protein